MNREQHDQVINRHIQNAINVIFPHGEGRVTRSCIEHHLRQIAQYAFTEGRNHALMGLMTVQDVAEHFGISPRRARALIANRHERFGVGMQVGNTNVWLVHRDELPELKPDERFKSS